MARYERDWFHAEVVRLEDGGSYLIRWIRPKAGYHSRWDKPDTRPAVLLVDEDDIRPMEAR